MAIHIARGVETLHSAFAAECSLIHASKQEQERRRRRRLLILAADQVVFQALRSSLSAEYSGFPLLAKMNVRLFYASLILGIADARTIWSSSPATFPDIIRQALPVGNGKLGGGFRQSALYQVLNKIKQHCHSMMEEWKNSA